MNGKNTLDGFKLYKDQIFNKDVSPKTQVHFKLIIYNRNSYLPLDLESPFPNSCAKTSS